MLIFGVDKITKKFEEKSNVLHPIFSCEHMLKCETIGTSRKHDKVMSRIRC